MKDFLSFMTVHVSLLWFAWRAGFETLETSFVVSANGANSEVHSEVYGARYVQVKGSFFGGCETM